MSNINFFRVLQSGGTPSAGEIDWDDFTLTNTSPNSNKLTDIWINVAQTKLIGPVSLTDGNRIDVYDFDTTGDVSDGFTLSKTGTTLTNTPKGITMNPAGTKIYAPTSTFSSGGTTGISQWNLSTAYDTSTMSADADEFVSWATLGGNIDEYFYRASVITPDGLTMYVVADHTNDFIPERCIFTIPLSTAFDITSHGTITHEVSKSQVFSGGMTYFEINSDYYLTYQPYDTTESFIFKNGTEFPSGGLPNDAIDEQILTDARFYMRVSPDKNNHFAFEGVNSNTQIKIYQYTTSF
jgi:hypothetical protein